VNIIDKLRLLIDDKFIAQKNLKEVYYLHNTICSSKKIYEANENRNFSNSLTNEVNNQQ
jgi:hypothetical protein